MKKAANKTLVRGFLLWMFAFYVTAIAYVLHARGDVAESVAASALIVVLLAKVFEAAMQEPSRRS